MSRKHAWIMSIWVALIPGCSNDSMTSHSAAAPAVETHKALSKREYYDQARARFIDEGWKAVPAKCSTQHLCGEYPELSTDMKTVVSCGVFKKENQTATICGESILDGLIVTSIEIDPKQN